MMKIPKASPFAWVSFAMMVGVMGTALISPLYALYKEQWSLQPSDISLIYVIYMAGALCGLLFIGRLPDRLGFHRVMRVGLGMILMGTVISMVAWNMRSLIVGRFLVGIASSMVTTSSTLGLTVLARPGNAHRIAMVTGFLIAVGFGLGPLMGGVMGQWAPSPLMTAYIPTLILGSLGLLAMIRLNVPSHAQPSSAKAMQWRELLPRLTWPDRHLSSAFALTCAMPFIAFGVFGMYASMAPLFLDKLVPWHGPIVSGAAMALILLASAVVQVIASRMPPHVCGSVGLVGLALSNAILMVNLSVRSGVLFALGVALTAIGHGMSMLAGMSMVNRLAKPENRSGMFATYLVIGYVGSMLPMMAMGWIADHWSMDAAVVCFCLLVMTLSVTVAVLFGRHRVIQG